MSDASHQIGSLRFRVDHRMPGPEGGPTLRVEDAGREVLRFDCFAKGGHWHLDPAGKDEIQLLPETVDALDWTVAELRRDAAGYLTRAGVQPPDPPALTAALDALEPALRNPAPDFDALSEARLRVRTGEKWRQYPEDTLALWVADMDFPVSEPIRRRLQRALDFGDLGYPLHPQPTGLPELFAERAKRLYGWKLEPRKVELLTEVVQGMYVALEQFTEEGDGVVIQTPIYPPFLGAVREMKRRVVENPLLEGEGGYRVDIGGLRRQADESTRMLMLCNPHNPTGRVMTREELEGLAELALERDWIVVSDEIHADLVHEGHRHIPFATLSPEIAERTITLTSASKAFNIAGLRCAVAAFGGSDLRRQFIAFPRHLRGGLGSLGIEATREAWTHSEPWLASVRAQLRANRDFVAEFVRTELPGVRHHSPQATYLAWLDCRELDLAPSPYEFFLNEAKVALSDGRAFGTPGEGFVRINFATSRGILSEALERMAKALR